ncbi:MAG TPA: metalloregulator ArsR/SmtB family transcription factor [Anaerolineales bacterium]
MKSTTVSWDYGTAYELFVSLMVLHHADEYGIRAGWAAGVRSRIPATERRLLEEMFPFLDLPIAWIHTLPEPKDSIAVQWAMRQIPAEERMIKILGYEISDKESCQIVLEVAKRRAWDSKDLNFFVDMFKKHKKAKSPYDREGIIKYLDWWARPDEFGDTFLSAIQAYHQAFFEEEEKRIGPILKQQLEIAQELSKTKNAKELLAELSKGVSYDELVETKDVVFIPAYWITPMILSQSASENKNLVLFGARPSNMSVIPGEVIPDGLVRTLKALADPTRLKILHDLAHDELAPSEIARRLHLRAPTVTHHMNELRMAGLVHKIIKGQETRYRTRREAFNAMCDDMNDFLDKTD